MTPMLHRAARALYGPEWQTPLAGALGINIRTVQRWAAGDFNPPSGVWADMLPLLTARREELRKAAPEITRIIKELRKCRP